jgi:hypothetical protein
VIQALSATYILPIRRTTAEGVGELTRYLEMIARACSVIVVDGSDERRFDEVHDDWSRIGLHVRPDPGMRGLNGKVRGVLTGVELATNERIVIADDDVRYDLRSLQRTVAALDEADLVRPQNFFHPAVWHACWDTARTLLNRVGGGSDFPGTLAVRRSVLQKTGGYCPDVLFENLELIRTVEAAGGAVVSPPDLYVARLPPSTRQFWEQRHRQAYDEFARPTRLLVSLSIAPLAVWMCMRRHRRRKVVVGMGVAVALAECGRSRAGGRRVFPISASLFAPLWLLERSVFSWVALGSWVRGGCPYAGGRLRRAASSRRALNARFSAPNSFTRRVIRAPRRAPRCHRR